jgi:hypothetical protein
MYCKPVLVEHLYNFHALRLYPPGHNKLSDGTYHCNRTKHAVDAVVREAREEGRTREQLK